MNLNRYAENNPVAMTDPYGLQATARLGNGGGSELNRIMLDAVRGASDGPGGLASSFLTNTTFGTEISSSIVDPFRSMSCDLNNEAASINPALQPITSVKEFLREQEVLDNTRLARVEVTPGSRWIYDKLVRNQRNMSAQDMLLYFRQMEQENVDYKASEAAWDAKVRQVESFIPGANVGHMLRDAIRVDYGWETVDLYASGRFGLNGAAEPSKGDYAESFTTLASFGQIGSALRGSQQALTQSSRIVSAGRSGPVFGDARALTSAQRTLLGESNASVTETTIAKRAVSMNDLRNLMLHTGDEFAMPTRQGERMILRGLEGKVPQLSEASAKEFAAAGWRFSGHTHTSGYQAVGSLGDKAVLNAFGQKQSAVWGATWGSGPGRFFSSVMDEINIRLGLDG